MAGTLERRRHRRFDISCRMRIEPGGGREVSGRTLNISDGGAYFVTDEVIEVGRKVAVWLSIPRDTANTFFLEQIAAGAVVVRREPANMPNESKRAGVALKFEKVLALDLP